MRCFLAAALPDGLREALAEAQGTLRDALVGSGARVRWVDPPLFHITLRFLGDVGEPVVTGFARWLDGLPDPAVVGLGSRRLGAFPGSERPPRVLWGDVIEPSGRLAGWAAAAERQAVSLGLDPERRPFMPHITLGRLGPVAPGPGSRIRSILRVVPVAAAEPQPCPALALMASQLGPGGASFRVLHRRRLDGFVPDGHP